MTESSFLTDTSGQADASRAAGAPDAPTDGEPRRRKRRRVFRRGTAETAAEDPMQDLAPAPAGGRSRDDTDLGWGSARGDDSDSRDQWLQDQRPPHYE